MMDLTVQKDQSYADGDGSHALFHLHSEEDSRMQQQHLDYIQQLQSKHVPKSKQAQWHFDRLCGIGASDSAAVLGLNPYKTAYDVWLEKTGRKVPEDISHKLAIRLGIKKEQVIAELYSEDKNVKLRRYPAKAHRDYPWLRCNPDRLIVGQKKGLEIKTGKFSHAWGDDGTDEVPIPYHIQSLHCLLVFGYEAWDLAAELSSSFGSQLRYYTITHNEELANKLIKSLTTFWFDYVINDKAPEPNTLTDVAQCYAKDNGQSLVADDTVYQEVTELKRIKSEMKDLDKIAKEKEVAIKKVMGEHALLCSAQGDTLARWKMQTRHILNQKALGLAHPELLQQYRQEQSCRVFKVSQ